MVRNLCTVVLYCAGAVFIHCSVVSRAIVTFTRILAAAGVVARLRVVAGLSVVPGLRIVTGLSVVASLGVVNCTHICSLSCLLFGKPSKYH